MFYKKKIEDLWNLSNGRHEYQYKKNKEYERAYNTLSRMIQETKNEMEVYKQQIETQGKVMQEHWKYIQALLDAEKQNRKDLNTVISKINQLKTKGKK